MPVVDANRVHQLLDVVIHSSTPRTSVFYSKDFSAVGAALAWRKVRKGRARPYGRQTRPQARRTEERTRRRAPLGKPRLLSHPPPLLPAAWPGRRPVDI